MLYGREAEQARIDALLAAARAGRSGALVLRGDAGIGKTALLDYAAAKGMATVRSAGIESEAELPFAGLHLLMRHGAPPLDTLPQRQREALLGAFGTTDHDPGDRMLIGLAVLSLLAEEAAEQPLLCLIDDAHWLDRATADTLLFAARRLDAEGVVMIFASRTGTGDFPAPGLDDMLVTGMRQDAAAALVDSRYPELSPTVRYRLLVESGGNPLALLELPAVLAAETPGPDPLPLTQRLRDAFHGHLSRLPDRTRSLLLVAAAAGAADLDTVLRAAAELGVGLADLQPAEEAGLVRMDGGGLVFRHPLLRSAVYQSAALTRRIAAHRALAETMTDPGKADLRAWQLASAATGPDETAAAALEATADRARKRSGYHGAVAAYARAADLSIDARARLRRLLPAAETAAETGQFDMALRLAEQAAALTDDPVLIARLDLVRGLAEFGAGRASPAHRLLLGAAARIRERDPLRSARILVQAVHPAWYLGNTALAEVAELFAGLDLPPDEPMTPIAQYMLGAVAARYTVDLREAAVRARDLGADSPRDLVQMCGAGLVVGQDVQVGDLAAELITECREQGRIALLPALLFFRAEAETALGRPSEGRIAATEGLRIAEDSALGQWISQHHAYLAYLSALTGREDDCSAAVARATAEEFGGDLAPGAGWAHAALGLLDLGSGRADNALRRFAPLTVEPARHHVAGLRVLPDIVEAAVRLGTPERAGEAMARLTAWAASARSEWIEALAQRCRGLLAACADVAAPVVEEHYVESLRIGGRPLEQARTRLVYGEWLRRVRRKHDARTQLQQAAEAFDQMAAVPWAQRARAELAALGTSGPAAAGPGVGARLTPQELQIVRLAAQGLSNRDIAAQLFLSPRTVGHHLYKAYPKLGVTSRGELAALQLGVG